MALIRKLGLFFPILVTVWTKVFPSYVRIITKVMETKFIRQKKRVRILAKVS